MMRDLRLLITFVLTFVTILSGAQNNKLTENLKKHVEYLASDSLEGRGLGTQGKLYAEIYIEEEFSKIGLSHLKGLDSYTQPFSFMYGVARINATNIIGVIEGSDSNFKNQYIVLGAHYDHVGWKELKGEKSIFNGADDNASGVASLIEIAKYLKENQSSLKRSVIIAAFDAEESGLLGSTHFVKHTSIPKSDIKAMFSIDMVGMLKANKGLELRGIELIENGKQLLELSNKNNLTIAKADAKMEGRTDTKPFLDNGIPAIHAFTGLKSPYHKPEDTAEKLDYEGMTSVCELLMDLSTSLANEEQLIAIQTITDNPKTKNDPSIYFGYKIGIGTSYLNFKNEEFRSKRSFSFDAGLYTMIKLSKLLYIKPEALYEYSKGRLFEDYIKTHSLTTPVQLVFKTPYRDEYTPRLNIGVGGFHSYHFKTSTKNINSDLINNDYGVYLSTGLEINKMSFDINWKYSKNNLFTNNSELEILRTSTKFSWSLRF